MSEKLQKIMDIAQGAMDHHRVPMVLLNEATDCFFPINVGDATANFTKPVFIYDGRELRRVDHLEIAKAKRSIDGSTYIGIGTKVASRDDEAKPKADPVPEPVADPVPEPVADPVPEPVAPPVSNKKTKANT